MRAKSIAALLMLVGVLLPLAGHGQRPGAESQAEHRSAVSPENRVDLNHTSIEELMKIPGMKRTWAQRIIRFRPYRTKQDLVEEGIVSNEVYGRIRDYVIVHRDKQ